VTRADPDIGGPRETTLQIRVVIVEDSPDDAEILVRRVAAAGFIPDWVRVETEDAYLSAIDDDVHVVLADYTMPRFGAMRALELLKELELEIPVIVVTGSVGEEAAVACMRAGAVDYLLKDRLVRLGPAITRALEDRSMREARHKAEAELRGSEERYRSLVHHSPLAIFELDPAGTIGTANPASAAVLGSGTSPPAGDSLLRLVSDRDRERVEKLIGQASLGRIVQFEFEPAFAAKRIVESTLMAVPAVEDAVRVMGIAQDITGRREAERALANLKERLQAENVYLQEEIRLSHDFGQILGQSSTLRGALERVELVAATDATVLIQGETGTGKELFARAVHDLSLRKGRTLVKVNCAALPSTLIESELFGHERGAFTGALSKRIGRFELADGGSLFLDEIGELPLDTQSKLLRVLQEGEFERLGGTETRRVDVRVIAATNRRLEEGVAEGTFRGDLYYRLNVVPIELPPLRERKGDVSLLTRFFVERSAKQLGRQINPPSQALLDALEHYEWPGNVRELANLIERAVILARGDEIRLEHILPTHVAKVAPAPAGGTPPSGTRVKTLVDVEREHITSVLDAAGGKIDGTGGAAEVLGVHPNTLRSRMERLGIQKVRRRRA
jgi:formate hydrogenlyase transcriptional activator